LYSVITEQWLVLDVADGIELPMALPKWAKPEPQLDVGHGGVSGPEGHHPVTA